MRNYLWIFYNSEIFSRCFQSVLQQFIDRFLQLLFHIFRNSIRHLFTKILLKIIKRILLGVSPEVSKEVHSGTPPEIACYVLRPFVRSSSRIISGNASRFFSKIFFNNSCKISTESFKKIFKKFLFE